MRIHTDTLTVEDFATAANWARAAGHGAVYLSELGGHGSRSRARAFEVKLTGDGSHSRRLNQSNTDYAATYDSWGFFLAMLFSLDPNMTCSYYKSLDDFNAQTRNQYHAPSHVL